MIEKYELLKLIDEDAAKSKESGELLKLLDENTVKSRELNISHIFDGNTSLDLNEIDTSKVVDMGKIFNKDWSNVDLSDFEIPEHLQKELDDIKDAEFYLDEYNFIKSSQNRDIALNSILLIEDPYRKELMIDKWKSINKSRSISIFIYIIMFACLIYYLLYIFINKYAERRGDEYYNKRINSKKE